MSFPLMLANRKVVGQMVGAVAFLPVTSRNYLAVGQGYSVDDGVLRAIVAAGCEWLDFWNMKALRHYRVRVQTFRANAKPYDFGWGRKWAAPMACYESMAQAQEA